MTNKTACADIRTQKSTERYHYKKKDKRLKTKELIDQFDALLLDMPLNELSASSMEISKPSLLKSFPVLNDQKIFSNDSVPKSEVDSLKKELLKAQVELLRLEQNEQQQIFENGGKTTARRDPRQEKAKKLGTASLVLAILGALFLFPALNAATGAFLTLVVLFDLFSLSIGISSLVKYRNLVNKTGRWQSILAISLIFGFPLLLIALLIFFFLVFWAW